jgi:hypothetical protein
MQVASAAECVGDEVFVEADLTLGSSGSRLSGSYYSKSARLRGPGHDASAVGWWL